MKWFFVVAVYLVTMISAASAAYHWLSDMPWNESLILSTVVVIASSAAGFIISML